MKNRCPLEEKRMKMIGCRVLMITVVLLLLFTGSPLWAQPDKIVLEGKTRPAVSLPHNRHVEAGLSCKDCHHIYENGKNILDEGKLEEGNKDIRCLTCHSQKSQLDLEKAFHKQCIGCHGKYQKEKKKTGPQYCGGCHVRK
jgi:Class III cytochrome C family